MTDTELNEIEASAQAARAWVGTDWLPASLDAASAEVLKLVAQVRELRERRTGLESRLSGRG
jgi:hypothetical protein